MRVVQGTTTLTDVEQLYLAHRHDARETARHLIGQGDADDAVQDAFVRLLAARQFLRSATPKYLYIVTRGIAIRQLQRRDRFVLAPEDVLVDLEARHQRRERGWRVAPPPRRRATMDFATT